MRWVWVDLTGRGFCGAVGKEREGGRLGLGGYIVTVSIYGERNSTCTRQHR